MSMQLTATPADAMLASGAKRGNMRYFIVFMLFVVGAINYADRAIFSIVGPTMLKTLNMDIVSLGYLMSTFGWAYVLGQLPGGWLLDRFGTKRVYIGSLFLWSLITGLLGFCDLMGGAAAATLFTLVFLMSLAESPSFPANARVVASWFPAKERGTASAIFTSAQYFALVLFMPIMGWITHHVGWQAVFWFMGSIGIAMSAIMTRVLYEPKSHPRLKPSELAYITAGGGMSAAGNQSGKANGAAQGPKLAHIKQLLCSRMMVGIYIGQFSINVLTWFFTTWFPIYLVQGRGMSILKVGMIAVLPACCGFVGGLLGGLCSDFMIKRGFSLSIARKTPIVCGMLLAMIMIACNYVDSVALVVTFMSIAFFGKGFGAQGWAVIADTAPREIMGLSSGIFNISGNLAGIVTPIVIAYILKTTGSFNGALIFVGLTALTAVCSYLFLVGEIRRLELKH